MDSGRDFLFEVAPAERDGQKRKQRKKTASVSGAVSITESSSDIKVSKYEAETDTFLVSLIDKCPCIQCGYPGSLIYVANLGGRKVWKMQCELCLIRWDGEPVDGVLEVQSDGGPVMREGRHAGKNFREIEELGDRTYIERLATMSRNKWLKGEAQKWLNAAKQASG